MKAANLLKLVGAGVLSLTIVAAPFTLPATAQVEAAEVSEEDDGFDWGLLGLLGLIGLAGLAGKKNNSPTVYQDPNVPTSR